MTRDRNKGFTLLELIIVIVIVGVLASAALPKLFSVIEGAHAAEALAVFTSARRAWEARYLMDGTYGNGMDSVMFSDLGLEDPSLAPNAHFDYYGIGGPDGYWMMARKKGPDDEYIFFGYNYDVVFLSNGLSVTPTGDDKFHWGATRAYSGFVPK